MKLALLLLALAHCPPLERPDLTPLEGYIIDVCYERDGKARRSCIKDAHEQAPFSHQCEFLKRFVEEAPHLAAVIRAANEVDQIVDDLSLSGNGEDVIVGLTTEAEEILKEAGCD